MPALSTSNGELLMAKVLEWKSFEDDIDREDDEGTAAVFWLATFEFTAASKTTVDLLFVWSDDNPEADVINTREAEDSRRNFWYCLYVGAVADPDLQIREGGDHPDPEITEEPGLNKKFFRTFGPQFGLKVKGGVADPGGLFPGSTTDWCPSWE